MRFRNSTGGRARHALLGVAALAAALWSGWAPVQAQDKYPSKPVTVVVPYPPAGLADIVARPLAGYLERELKQPFVVLNKPGATGGIGAQYAANAAPDGYTVLVTLIGLSTLPAVSAAQGKTPMYTRDQFEPIARLVSDPCVIFVQKSAPWNTFAELIADAKRRPDEIIYISTGPFGPTHLPMEMLMQATGTKFRHLPTTGGGPAVTMLLSGGGHIFFSIPALGAQHVAAGTLKVLASASPNRVPEFPDAPTMKELGVEMDYSVWAGMFVPKGTPAEIKRTIGAVVTKAAKDADVKGNLAKSGVALAYQDADEFRTWWDSDTKRLESIIKTIVKSEKK